MKQLARKPRLELAPRVYITFRRRSRRRFEVIGSSAWDNRTIKRYGNTGETGAADIEVAEPEIESIYIIEPEPDIEGRHLLLTHTHIGKVQAGALGFEFTNADYTAGTRKIRTYPRLADRTAWNGEQLINI
jgi:hypothetical protein